MDMRKYMLHRVQAVWVAICCATCPSMETNFCFKSLFYTINTFRKCLHQHLKCTSTRCAGIKGTDWGVCRSRKSPGWMRVLETVYQDKSNDRGCNCDAVLQKD